MSFTAAQEAILLRPITGSRIEKRKQAGMTLSYLSQHDVRAHLIRLFGFGGFDLTTDTVHLMFEEQVTSSKSGSKQWSVGYQVTMSLTVRNPDGKTVCTYSESAVGSSSQPSRGDAHDMALKTASSDAMKRCAINLGDQFGLSLYDNSSTAPIVKNTVLAMYPDTSGEKAPVADEQPAAGSEVSDAVEALKLPAESVAELQAIVAVEDAAERILAVANYKSSNPDALHLTVEVDGQHITVGRFLDLVAAGQFTGGAA